MVELNNKSSPVDISSLTLQELEAEAELPNHLKLTSSSDCIQFWDWLLFDRDQVPMPADDLDHDHASRPSPAPATAGNIHPKDTPFYVLEDKHNTSLDHCTTNASSELLCKLEDDSFPVVLHDGKNADLEPGGHMDDAKLNGLIDGVTGVEALAIDKSDVTNEVGLLSDDHCTLPHSSQVVGAADSEVPNNCPVLMNLKDNGEKTVKKEPPNNTDMISVNNKSNGDSDSSSDEAESDNGSSESESNSSSGSEEEDEDVAEEEEDDNDDANNNCVTRKEICGVEDIEEGEIHNFDNEEVVFSTDDEEEGGPKGPIKSKNELDALPPVPHVDVVLEPQHQTLPVGVVSSIIGSKVIIDGSVKHNPLTEGSILWITETRSLLGLVDEIFGPVKNPYYIVRYNSDREVPAGIHEGTAVSFVFEFSNHIINEKSLYKKGYDASGENDEELSDEVEFSDDEKEAEDRRSQRQAKRGTGNGRHANQDKINVKKIQLKNTGFQKNVLHKVPRPAAGVVQPTNVSGQLVTPSVTGKFGSVGSLCSTGSATPFGSGSSMVPVIPHAMQSGCFIGAQQQNLLLQQRSAAWGRGVPPLQQQNIGPVLNVPPFQQLNDPHPYHHYQYQQQQHQQQLFSGFPNGIMFQRPFVSHQGPPPNFGLNGLLNPSIGPLCLGAPAQGSFNQAPFDCNINLVGVSGINNSAQCFGQRPPATVQGYMYPAMQFNMGASTASGSRPPYASSGSRPPYT